ncbi:type 1 glutamine amidotransferase family protein [Anaerocolumna sp. AGMB13020]|uniref:type 1 glutamine amidotransferase family protein n=1 Tax=Anaerocolumna sp. AGMB13020 TaxID=3081750 RepID=UPI002954D2FC|nr:type 1 glutamine amidotransferase family protein [Anaerocolumna sp. AGMB13020]WOO35889.1 type 1 glutamine amidotransferase family protein [Anaerocolumna sp. AGMB13020]
MHHNIVYLYIFDTMADWEVGYITAELNSGRFFKKDLAPVKIITVGMNKSPVVTMGGLKILPDIEVDAFEIDKADALILPGGDTWTESVHLPILKTAEKCVEKGIVVAGICGATIGLARKGLLDTKNHTSNDLGYLKAICPNYKGEQYYNQETAVADGKLITASGIAPLEFSFQVLKALEVFSAETLGAWYRLYKTKEEKYYLKLMDSIC